MHIDHPARKHRLEDDCDPSPPPKRSRNAAPSPRIDPVASGRSTVSQYSHYLTNEQKNHTLRHMLQSCLSDPSLSMSALSAVAREHEIKAGIQKTLVLSALAVHSCSWSCLVRSADAQAAGQLLTDQVLIPPNRIQDLLPQGNNIRTLARKHRREKASQHITEVAETERVQCAANWPQVLSDTF
ncbi:hypothetical protein C8F04DRAFT_1148145 [Mycena alexandri]|uniref:Uncharacterized protein n=2 Tax=Mycena alexandri TaxID=1745969 RepID=A0AAD6S2B9_9AGAR|nr:hypothetical protein C8F04DRAFT_1148145 [Mycena alexandri]